MTEAAPGTLVRRRARARAMFVGGGAAAGVRAAGAPGPQAAAEMLCDLQDHAAALLQQGVILERVMRSAVESFATIADRMEAVASEVRASMETNTQLLVGARANEAEVLARSFTTLTTQLIERIEADNRLTRAALVGRGDAAT